jgi:hypothetical protein
MRPTTFYFDMVRRLPQAPRNQRRLYPKSGPDQIRLRVWWATKLGIITHGEARQLWGLDMASAQRATSAPPVYPSVTTDEEPTPGE